MWKNAETTTQLYSFHMPSRLCSKSFKLGFSSMWPENFQRYKLDLEKQRNQRSNSQHPLDHKKAREFQKNIYSCFTDYAKAFDCVDHNKLWKILQAMGIPDHHTCFLRNLYAGQETTVRIGHETKDWSQIEKGVHQGCPPAYLTYRQSTSCEMPSWMKHKLKSRLAGKI